MSGQSGRPSGRSLLQTADVEPLDVDGVRTIAIGTVLWVIAALGMLPFKGQLDGAGHTWWLWTAFTGAGLGVIGVLYCLRRRNRT